MMRLPIDVEMRQELGHEGRERGARERDAFAVLLWRKRYGRELGRCMRLSRSQRKLFKTGKGLCLRHVSRFCMLAHSHVHAGKPGQRQLRMQVDHRCTHVQVRPARTVSALQHVHAGLGRVIGQRQCPCRHDGAAQAGSRRRLQRVAGPPRRRRADNAPGGRQRRGGHRRPGTRPRAGQ